MFSKSRINEPGPKQGQDDDTARAPEATAGRSAMEFGQPTQTKAKPPASVLSSDLTITGNIKTTGDIVVEGTVEGDVRAHLLTVGEGSTVRGEIVADDIVVNGRVIGRVRGLKVRLTSTARVEGDIVHKTIAIESGAHFEGSVQRQEDPLNNAPRDAGAARPAAGNGSSQPQRPATAAAGKVEESGKG